MIVSIPQCLLVSPLDVLTSEMGCLIKRWRPTFTGHQILSLFLLIELKKGRNSAWHPFIQSLPACYTLPHYFSHGELDFLTSHIRERADKEIARAHQAFKDVHKFCQHHWPSGVDWASWEKFLWAWCTISSRAVYLKTEASAEGWLDLSHTDENNQALCPYLDLINHTSTAQMRAGLNTKTACYEIVTEDSFQAHDQVFISYGPHDNTTLFLFYGFTLPTNVYNSVFFSIEDLTELLEVFHVDSWARRKEVLCQYNLLRRLACSTEGISWNLQAALSVLAMDLTQLQECWRILNKEEIHPALEANVLIMARHLIGTALRMTKQFLADRERRAQMDGPTTHTQLALSLVRDDIGILTSALHAVS
ncbi:hypothetical protein C0Q70_10960 [Pomacea canaliculata]|uniref:SET domain-containing protein n=2 Tax=Pomacea canaliculata TaxID=400727 RepID=A0A2T7P4P8_POMCA|nr:hypothetical protein C0Q70_10960 [Pomacea canaliculata]